MESAESLLNAVESLEVRGYKEIGKMINISSRTSIYRFLKRTGLYRREGGKVVLNRLLYIIYSFSQHGITPNFGRAVEIATSQPIATHVTPLNCFYWGEPV
jgi:hypothetical protein